MKAINPDIYTGGSYTLRPDSTSNVVAATAYNLMLNYFNGDYKPINGQPGPDNGVYSTLGADSMPLFNGNISSMGLSVRKLDNPLLYNYRYDQLNRLLHMDAWKRTSTAWSSITKLSDYQEDIGYDPNGNILRYHRNGNTAGGLDMDKMQYVYTSGTNKLDHIYDTVSSGNYSTDIDGQSAGNYKYDSIGQLIHDGASGIDSIYWTVYGKIARIIKNGGDTVFLFTYDPGGNRISKSVIHSGDTLTTWYVRDAQGNVLSVYTYGDPAVHGKDLTQTELHIYGNSRLGILKPNVDVYLAAQASTFPVPLLGTGDSITFARGNKFFELTNHLGNVLVTISDKRFGVTPDSVVRYFIPDVVSANDYYPFGSLEPGRSYAQSGTGYRYGFNGKEKDDEVKGAGDQIDYGMRVYDPRVGRFLSVDPLQTHFPDLSVYQYSGNTPIQAVDLDGKEPKGYMEYWNAKNDEYMTKWGYTVQDFYDYKTKQVWTVMNYPNTDEYYYWQSKTENGARLFSPLNTNLNKDPGKSWTGVFKQFIPHHASEAAEESGRELAGGFAALVTLPFIIEGLVTLGSEGLAAIQEKGVDLAVKGIATYYKYAPAATAVAKGVAGVLDESGGVGMQNAAANSIKFSATKMFALYGEGHIFTDKHIVDGLLNLGNDKLDIYNRIENVIQSNLAKLAEGDNFINTTINGVESTVKAFVKSGEIQSINTYVGKSARQKDVIANFIDDGTKY